ncbi:hypothetical protein K9N68_31985 [Kovacikia minuta CCNUW1]|uniref:hypothetical protein n=1 Tax=Kovacikia minuta TaxID=2931930 RepID=UPI001CCD0162|nr:hypothetical protein [Kovacikia minuta]UBF26100.1 hypothetical protein K9N68_31985 [Kovacikia minuta CCNUW1]
MLNNSLTDFHRGWMIEIISGEKGFQSTCRSPVGEQLNNGEHYPHHFIAWRIGMELIDQFYACYALKTFLRDAYEAEHLDFEEWRSLNQSLVRNLT